MLTRENHCNLFWWKPWYHGQGEGCSLRQKPTTAWQEPEFKVTLNYSQSKFQQQQQQQQQQVRNPRYAIASDLKTY